jgi:hypothetical protein
MQYNPVGLSYASWVRIGYALLMGLKLSLLTADGWDLDHVRDVLNFSQSLEKLIKTLETAVQVRSEDQEHILGIEKELDIFSRFLRRICRKHCGDAFLFWAAIGI